MITNNSKNSKQISYDRLQALNYTHQWAQKRNPIFYNFDTLGGDCTNFVSQVLFSGCGVMNFTPNVGWFFQNLKNRTPSWTSVDYLYNFLTTNRLLGPFGERVDFKDIVAGDILQLSPQKTGNFNHSLIIVETPIFNDFEKTLVAAHTLDCDYKPLSLYRWERIRFIHIIGARK